ncbi:hypothetical protein RSJ42_04695 [Methanosarcina hadiensis]|uniref:TolB family protein n=1 Tax=Methanosarcina hadiensis TaxID=3078083 RepID=UPI003977BB5B
MREFFRAVCLLMFIVILVLPVDAATSELSGYGNFTEGSGLNRSENASINYFDSDSGSICVTAGKTVDNGEIIPADRIVEEITYLTDSPESELFPVWTPDSNHILYTVKRNDSDNFELYKMRANGSEIEKISIGEGNFTGLSDINPGGTELVLTRSNNSESGLYLANLQEGTVFPVADDLQVSEGWGSWCRLGKKITYTKESAGTPSQLWIVDIDGSNNIRLGTSENVGIGKDWCPLGLRVLYSAKDLKEAYDLWVIDFYGTNQAQLTNTSYNEWNPSFSPDGKWIVYVSDEGESPDIWIMDIEGNYRSRLTNFTGSPDSVPRWSPDGSKIVFTGYGRGNNSTNVTDSGAINDSAINVSGIGLINSSNTGAIKSGIDQVNGSDIAAINGSDIVVIKLLFEPYNPPSPKVTGLKVSSIKEVSREGNVTISLTVKNEGGNASEGNISVSFPGKERIEGVNGTGSSIDVHSEGNPVPGINGEIVAQYPLVELTEYEWSAGQEETLNVTVVPNNETEEIVFFVRAGLKDDRTETFRRDPLTSTDKDQQGIDAYRHSLKVT